MRNVMDGFWSFELKLLKKTMAPESIAAAMELIRIEVMRELQHYGEDNSCISLSVVFTKVFRWTGYEDAYPLSVRVSIYNRPSIDWMEHFARPNVTKLSGMQWSESGSRLSVYLQLRPSGFFPKITGLDTWQSWCRSCLRNRHGLARLDNHSGKQARVGDRSGARCF